MLRWFCPPAAVDPPSHHHRPLLAAPGERVRPAGWARPAPLTTEVRGVRRASAGRTGVPCSKLAAAKPIREAALEQVLAARLEQRRWAGHRAAVAIRRAEAGAAPRA